MDYVKVLKWLGFIVILATVMLALFIVKEEVNYVLGGGLHNATWYSIAMNMVLVGVVLALTYQLMLFGRKLFKGELK